MSAELGCVLDDLIDGQGNLAIVLDLRDLRRIDHSGIETLRAASGQIVARGGRLRLASPAGAVFDSVTLSGLAPLIDTSFEDEHRRLTHASGPVDVPDGRLRPTPIPQARPPFPRNDGEERAVLSGTASRSGAGARPSLFLGTSLTRRPGSSRLCDPSGPDERLDAEVARGASGPEGRRRPAGDCGVAVGQLLLVAAPSGRHHGLVVDEGVVGAGQIAVDGLGPGQAGDQGVAAGPGTTGGRSSGRRRRPPPSRDRRTGRGRRSGRRRSRTPARR